MRKGALFVVIMCAFMLVCNTGCTNKNVVPADSIDIDSIRDTICVDTLEELISEQPMPKAADELFDDFIFNFAANRKLQLSRIAFPLPVMYEEYTMVVDKEDWQMERFFMDQGFYTLIFDSRKHQRLAKDTSVNHVVVEEIDLINNNVKSFNFNRLSGQWNMVSIDNDCVSDNENASFLQFYDKFATDSAFLMKSLGEPISFTGPSPDDDFATVTSELMPEDWEEVGLVQDDLPNGVIYNIIYGQKYTNENEKVFLMRGIANGLEVELTFKRIDGQWKLVKVVE